MNERIRELAEQAIYIEEEGLFPREVFDKEKFALLIIYDFLSELTNDDDLGEARVATIQRLSDKWGVLR